MHRQLLWLWGHAGARDLSSYDDPHLMAEKDLGLAIARLVLEVLELKRNVMYTAPDSVFMHNAVSSYIQWFIRTGAGGAPPFVPPPVQTLKGGPACRSCCQRRQPPSTAAASAAVVTPVCRSSHRTADITFPAFEHQYQHLGNMTTLIDAEHFAALCNPHATAFFRVLVAKERSLLAELAATRWL